MSQPAAAGLHHPNDAAHEAAHDEHSSFIKTPQQLLVVLVLAFVVPIVGILLLVYYVVADQRADPSAFAPASVSARLQPIGTVVVVDANAPRVERSGEEVVKTVCGACHTTGAANAPKIGDKASWGNRFAMGLGALTKSAIVGKGAMPPRGGVPDLSDFEIARSIVVMANQSGANFKEPPAPASAAKPAPGAVAGTPRPVTGDPAKSGSAPTSVGTPAAGPVSPPVMNVPQKK